MVRMFPLVNGVNACLQILVQWLETSYELLKKLPTFSNI